MYRERDQCCDQGKRAPGVVGVWEQEAVGRTELYGVADKWNVSHVAAFPAVLWDKGEVKPEQKWCRSHQKDKKGFVESV